MPRFCSFMFQGPRTQSRIILIVMRSAARCGHAAS